MKCYREKMKRELGVWELGCGMMGEVGGSDSRKDVWGQAHSAVEATRRTTMKARWVC